jgi:lipopolysaccharide export system ATP-binding protein
MRIFGFKEKTKHKKIIDEATGELINDGSGADILNTEAFEGYEDSSEILEEPIQSEVEEHEHVDPLESEEHERLETTDVLRTENLVKIYGKRTVANQVSIDVTQGEIVGLLGPNGAGKTTTFYMTTGLITPNSGKIFINDTEITKYPVYKRAKMGIGYLAQEASVFRKLSVEDNIRSILEMTGKSKEYQKEKLESLISEFSLEKVRKNYGDRLSGGERRRTEIARCLAIDPKFIMLDEPFAGVDPIAVEEIQSVVYKLKAKNIGILITDHNANETLSITDRAYLLFEGKILFQGSSEELAENPVVREKYLGRNFEFRRKVFS